MDSEIHIVTRRKWHALQCTVLRADSAFYPALLSILKVDSTVQFSVIKYQLQLILSNLFPGSFTERIEGPSPEVPGLAIPVVPFQVGFVGQQTFRQENKLSG